jgi:phage-related minor tail protein
MGEFFLIVDLQLLIEALHSVVGAGQKIWEVILQPFNPLFPDVMPVLVEVCHNLLKFQIRQDK